MTLSYITSSLKYCLLFFGWDMSPTFSGATEQALPLQGAFLDFLDRADLISYISFILAISSIPCIFFNGYIFF